MEDSNQSNDCLKTKLENKLTNAQKNRELIVKEIQERLKEHVSHGCRRSDLFSSHLLSNLFTDLLCYR